MGKLEKSLILDTYIRRRKSSPNNELFEKTKKRETLRRVSVILGKCETLRTAEEISLLDSCTDVVKQILQRQNRIQQSKERILEKEDPLETIDQQARQLASVLSRARHLVCYTGAGISTAACIPDYRGSQGIWTLLQKGQSIGQHDLSLANPTFTHMALYELHRRKILQYVLSQNCDGLHLRSGMPRSSLSEVHGNMYVEVCKNCTEYWRLFDTTELTARYCHKTNRRCHVCGKPLVDTIVHFGERGSVRWPLNWDGACRHADNADVILCLGSSLKVLKKYSWLWAMDRPKHKRPKIYIVNLQWTPKDAVADMKINGKCDDVMALVMKYMNINVPTYSRRTDPIFAHATMLAVEEQHTVSQPMLKSTSDVSEKTESDDSDEDDDSDEYTESSSYDENSKSETNHLSTITDDVNKPQLHSITEHETEYNEPPSGIGNVLRSTTDSCNGVLPSEENARIPPIEIAQLHENVSSDSKSISLPNENDKESLVCPDSLSKRNEIGNSFISLCKEPISDGAAKFVPKTEIFKLDLPSKINSLDCQIKIENFEDQHMMGELLSDLKTSSICGKNPLKALDPTKIKPLCIFPKVNKRDDLASLEIKLKPSQDSIHDMQLTDAAKPQTIPIKLDSTHHMLYTNSISSCIAHTSRLPHWYDVNYAYSGLHSIIHPPPTEVNLWGTVIVSIFELNRELAECEYCFDKFAEYQCQFYRPRHAQYAHAKKNRFGKVILCECCDEADAEYPDKSNSIADEYGIRNQENDTALDVGVGEEKKDDDTSEKRAKLDVDVSAKEVVGSTKVQPGWYGKGYGKFRRKR